MRSGCVVRGKILQYQEKVCSNIGVTSAVPGVCDNREQCAI